MRLNIYLVLIIFCVLILGSCEPPLDGPNPEDVYVKYYGQGTNEAHGLVLTDGGDVIILATNTISNTNSDIYLIKTGIDGNEIQSVTLDISNESLDVPTKIKAIGNDEYLVTGYIDADPVVGVWFKINSSLEIISTDSTGASGYNFIEGVYLTDIIKSTETDDAERFVVLGHTTQSIQNDPIDDPGNFQIFLSKVDDNDSTYWTKPHGKAGDDEATALYEKDNGSLMIIGTTQSASGNYTGKNVSIIETTSRGTSDQNSRISGIPGSVAAADDIPYGVIKTPSGFSVVGSTRTASGQASFYMGLNHDGDTIAGRTHLLLPDNGLASQAFSIVRTSTNEFIVVGSFPSFISGANEGGNGTNKQEEMMVMKLSAFGEHREGYDQNFGSTSGNDQAKAVISLPGGDVLVAATVDFGSGVKLVTLMRLNQNGELKD
ncbi:MAG: hypothetical protein RIC35_18345 [Marinoscillum sp.]